MDNDSDGQDEVIGRQPEERPSSKLEKSIRIHLSYSEFWLTGLSNNLCCPFRQPNRFLFDQHGRPGRPEPPILGFGGRVCHQRLASGCCAPADWTCCWLRGLRNALTLAVDYESLEVYICFQILLREIF
ncbi:MAG: hypothetical protein VB875_12990, partial [Pirellulales bacterium]